MQPVTRIIIEIRSGDSPAGPPVMIEQQIPVEEHAAHVASGLGEPAPSTVAAAEGRDRAQLLAALEAAHKRDHELVGKLKELGEALTARTIERDHFKHDSYLWGLIVAWVIDTEGDGDEWSIDTDVLQRYHGRAITGSENDGTVTVTLGDRLPPSAEGESG